MFFFLYLKAYFRNEYENTRERSESQNTGPKARDLLNDKVKSITAAREHKECIMNENRNLGFIQLTIRQQWGLQGCARPYSIDLSGKRVPNTPVLAHLD